MANCFLFTVEYPYGFSETFLETEISFLSDSFENVYIFSYANKKVKNVRELPKNCHCFKLNMVNRSFRYAFYSLYGLLYKDKNLKKTGGNLKQTIANLYYLGRGGSAYQKTKKIIKDNDLLIDNSVYYSYWFTDLAYVASLLAKEGNNCKCVSRAHGYDIYAERNPLKYLPYQPQILDNLSSLHVCSYNGAEFLKRKYSAYIEKIKTEYLGTSDYGVAPSNYKIKKIVTCSQLIDVKRVTLFAEAYVILRQSCDNVKWICIGDGPQLESIKDIVSKYKKDVLFTGAIENKEVFEIYKSEPVTYICNVSSSEGIPVSLMEAMSMGIPSIATDVGGTSELVDEKCGFLLPKNLTPETLKDFLEKALYIDEKKYIELRKNSREKWDNKFNANKNYNHWATILKTQD